MCVCVYVCMNVYVCVTETDLTDHDHPFQYCMQQVNAANDESSSSKCVMMMMMMMMMTTTTDDDHPVQCINKQ